MSELHLNSTSALACISGGELACTLTFTSPSGLPHFQWQLDLHFVFHFHVYALSLVVTAKDVLRLLTETQHDLKGIFITQQT